MTALKGAGGVTVTYNSNALTNYVNAPDLQNTLAELESTHLGSTAETADAGLVSSTLNLGGDWAATLDGFLGPDSLAGTKRTVAIVIGGAVTYTWAAAGDVGGFITNYQIQTTASGKLTWSAQLRLSGLGVRTV
jgi:hypothetical protein